MKKLGQSTSGVAALVLVIGLFVVAYVLFLPVEERRALLGEGNASSASSGGAAGAKTLFIEYPGKLKPVATAELTHEISPINLFLKVEPKIESLANTLSITKNLFSSSSPSINFEVEDLSNLEKISLYFSVQDPKGKLKITLNGNDFYTEDLKNTDLKIVSLPVGLVKKNNEVKFSVSSPGAAFWSTNHYTLKDVSVKEEFEKINSKERRAFTISEQEKQNLKQSELEYFMYCNSLTGDYSQLKIYLNDKNLFTGLINCAGTSNTIEIDTAKIKAGSNELMFVIDQGDFLFSNIKVMTTSKEVSFPTYHFVIENEDAKSIADKKLKAYLNLELESNGKAKRASIGVNNREVLLDTTSAAFSRDISSLVNEGDNIIKIIPNNEFNLKTLSVKLQ